MSPELINSLAALFTAIAVVGVMIQGWFIKTAIQDVSRHTNSMKDELVAEVRLASYAKGELAGKGQSSTTVLEDHKDAKEQSDGIPKKETKG